jgi:hypothetical protein
MFANKRLTYQQWRSTEQAVVIKVSVICYLDLAEISEFSVQWRATINLKIQHTKGAK